VVLSSLGLACVAARSQEPLAAAAGDAVDDKHERPVSRLLREATRTLRLRRTTLKECAPRYAVHAPKGLEWADALAYADARFGGDKVRRALFLRKHYARGQPVSSLRALGLAPAGASFFMGSGRTWELVVVEPEKRPGGAPRGSWEAPVTIGVSASHGEWAADDATGERRLDRGKSVLFGPPTLTIRGVKLRDITFDSLTFDAADKLISFTFSTDADDASETKESFLIGGNTTGEDGSDFYWAYVRDAEGETIEIRNYDEDLFVTLRSVMKPGSAETIYADKYLNGVPYERVFYRYANGAGNIVRRVRFRLPEPSVDDAALEKAFELLKSEDPRRRRRARHTLVLAGATAVAAIKGRLSDATEEQTLEFVKVLQMIGSPDAVDILVDLLGHASDAVPGKACSALISIGQASRVAVIRALESQDSSDRAKRCCSYVLSALSRRKAKR
jgi:hypothetical protein